MYVYKITRRWHKHPTCEDGIFLFNISGASINAICWCAASFKNWIRKPTSIKMGCQLSVCARFFSQKDRNAVRPETIIYIYIHTILAEYLEYSEFQPYGCEQKKILRISEVDICIYIYIGKSMGQLTHTDGISHVYTKQVQHVYIYIYR